LVFLLLIKMSQVVLSTEIQNEIKTIFNQFAQNKVKELHYSLLPTLLKEFGQSLDKEELNDIYEMYKLKETKTFSLELLTTIIRDNIYCFNKGALIDAFKFFDQQNNGYIEKRELIQRLKQYGTKLSDAEIKNYADILDIEKNGKIPYLKIDYEMFFHV